MPWFIERVPHVDGSENRGQATTTDGRLLSEINAALAAPRPARLSPELERQYALRQGPRRRRQLARSLRLLALAMVAAFGLDPANGSAHLIDYAIARTGIATLCVAAAWLLSRFRMGNEFLLYGLPLLSVIIGTEALGEWAAPHYADRYMMAAAFAALAGLTIAPVGPTTGRLVPLLAILLFPLVPVLMPGSLPLVGNLDIVAFVWGILAMASLIARLNMGHARTVFLHMLRHELMAVETTMINAELRWLSSTDALTGLPNRRTFDAALQRFQADDRGVGFGLALIDVDRFKAFNDAAGHEAGDACLRGVAEVLARALRSGEMVARYGGEEFAVLCPCREEDLAAIGERLRRAVEEAGMPHPGLNGAAVTISVGLSWWSRTDRGRRTTSELLREADAALYEAKRAGRNRVATAN